MVIFHSYVSLPGRVKARDRSIFDLKSPQSDCEKPPASGLSSEWEPICWGVETKQMPVENIENTYYYYVLFLLNAYIHLDCITKKFRVRRVLSTF